MVLYAALVACLVLLGFKSVAEVSESRSAQSVARALTFPLLLATVILIFSIAVRIMHIVPELSPYF